MPLIEAAESAGPGSVFVIELSSYQLESTLAFHAEGAAFLNLTPDHLARHGDMETYRRTKLRIFEGQTADDLRVVPVAHPEWWQDAREPDGPRGSAGPSARPGAMPPAP